MDSAAKPPRGEILVCRRFINRNDPANLQRMFRSPLGLALHRFRIAFAGAGIIRPGEYLELRLDDLQAASSPRVLLHLAVERHQLAGFELVFEIGSMEPDALERRASLPKCHFEDGHALGAEEHGGP